MPSCLCSCESPRLLFTLFVLKWREKQITQFSALRSCFAVLVAVLLYWRHGCCFCFECTERLACVWACVRKADQNERKRGDVRSSHTRRRQKCFNRREYTHCTRCKRRNTAHGTSTLSSSNLFFFAFNIFRSSDILGCTKIISKFYFYFSSHSNVRGKKWYCTLAASSWADEINENALRTSRTNINLVLVALLIVTFRWWASSAEDNFVRIDCSC